MQRCLRPWRGSINLMPPFLPNPEIFITLDMPSSRSVRATDNCAGHLTKKTCFVLAEGMQNSGDCLLTWVRNSQGKQQCTRKPSYYDHSRPGSSGGVIRSHENHCSKAVSTKVLLSFTKHGIIKSRTPASLHKFTFLASLAC